MGANTRRVSSSVKDKFCRWVREGRGRMALTGLHRHEGAPYGYRRAVQQACDDVAEDEQDIRPVSPDLSPAGLVCSTGDGLEVVALASVAVQQRLRLTGCSAADWCR